MNTDEVPSRIGRFFVLRRIGAGGMGRVFLGYDEELGRKLAIKLLHGDADREVRARLLREAQALARLSHPHVVTIYEVGEEADGIYLAMEYVEGETLRRWVQEEPRSSSSILAQYLQAGHGLAAAHRTGILHRDFKPDNAIVGRDGRVRVLDFGLARSERALAQSEDACEARTTHDMGDLNVQMTVVGRVVGTPAYMSPEQLDGGLCDARSDIFAYSVALWEALYGIRPFRGESIEELSRKIRRGALQEGGERDVPRWLRTALMKGFAGDPEARWQTMDGFLQALTHGSRRLLWRQLLGALLGLIILAVAIVAITNGYLTWQKSQAIAACQKEASAVDAVWNDTARAKIRTSLGESESTGDAVDSLVGILDDYALHWRDAAQDVCERGLDDEEWLRLQVKASSCLDERLWSLETLISILSRDDLAPLQAGRRIVKGMPSIDDCVSQEKIEERPSLPDDPHIRAENRAVREEVTEAYMLLLLGRVQDALEIAEPLIERADVIEWAPLRASTRLLNGRLYKYSANAEASRLLQEGYFVAFDAGYDRLAASLATELIIVAGVGNMDPSEGRLWARLARGLLGRQPERQGLRLAMIEDRVGQLEAATKAFDEAEAAYLRGLALTVEALGEEHFEVGQILLNLGNICFEQGDLDKAASFWQRALEIHERTVGPEHPATALIYANLGALYSERKEYEEALRLTLRALKIHEQSGSPRGQQDVICLANIGEYYGSLDRLADAHSAYSRSLSIAEKIFESDHQMMIAPLHGRANTYARQGDLEAAAADLRRARAVEVVLDDQDGVAATDLRLASIFVARDVERAEGIIDAALVRLQEVYGARSDRALDALVTVAEENLVNERLVAAIILLERALSLSASVVAPVDEGAQGALQVEETRMHASSDVDQDNPAATDEAEGGLERIADARFALARALASQGGADARVASLMASAEALYLSLNGPPEVKIRELRAWRERDDRGRDAASPAL